MNAISNQQPKKRKKRTSNEQYEIYLKEMENDYCLRSGTVNPGLPENYITDKWSQLTEKLNCIGNGPQLSVEEWKRRFQDWKNATRAKYRKLQENRNRTGGGSQADMQISNIEERGLAVWGHATGKGIGSVRETGLQVTKLFTNEPFPVNPITSIDHETEEISECYQEIFIENDEKSSFIVNNTVLDEQNNSNNKNSSSSSSSNNNTNNNNRTDCLTHPKPVTGKSKQKSKEKRLKALNEVATNLLNAHIENTKINEKLLNCLENFTTAYREIENKKLKLRDDIENKKLKLQEDIENKKLKLQEDIENKKLLYKEKKLKFKIEKLKLTNKKFSFG